MGDSTSPVFQSSGGPWLEPRREDLDAGRLVFHADVHFSARADGAVAVHGTELCGPAGSVIGSATAMYATAAASVTHPAATRQDTKAVLIVVMRGSRR